MTAAKELLRDLHEDPGLFHERGRAYQLLQEYFQGLPLETLRPLLTNGDPLIRRAGVWIASELGHEATDLLEEAISLVDDGDRYVRYHALEIVMVCSDAENVGGFVHVVRSLDCDDDVIRQLAMRLVANASKAQIEAAARFFERQDVAGASYKTGLLSLLELDQRFPDRVIKMIDDPTDRLIRKFGAILGKRLFPMLPQLIQHASLISDGDVCRFAREVLETQSAGEKPQNRGRD